jgi:hypothetical protein
MSRAMRVLGVLLPFVAAAASCGGGAYTAGDACSTVGTAMCNRFNQCDLLMSGVTVSSCKGQWQDECCGDDCGETAPTKEDEELVKAFVNDCANALKTFSCDLLYEYYLPAECDFLTYAAAPVVRQSVLPEKQASTEALRKTQIRQAAALKARNIMVKTFGLRLPQ